MSVELLRDLVNVPSISGDEEACADRLVEFFEDHDREVWTDEVGNVRAPADDSVLLTSHVDTVAGTPPGDGDPSATPSGVASKSLTVTERGCGSQDEDASVSFDDDGVSVSITGTIWGNDSCYTAVFSDIRLDGGSLTVVVASESDADPDTACAECITQIEYEAMLTFDGALPEDVAVMHEHGDEQSEVTSTTR